MLSSNIQNRQTKLNDIVSIESYSGIRVALTKDVKPW